MVFFSNADVPIAFEVLGWVQSFLVEPHPLMKRSSNNEGGSICPFAKAVLDENALYMVFHHEVNGKSAEAIESIVLNYREPFKKTTPFHESDRLKEGSADHLSGNPRARDWRPGCRAREYQVGMRP